MSVGVRRNDVVHLFNVVAVDLVQFSPLFWDTHLFSENAVDRRDVLKDTR